ncbi:MAG TPA: NADH-quinone oxidoreductase subunit J [Anaerolineaceae bacterium]|jgi:NADH-quinone oxidoreductase subunit J|nr:NADH-quinone oxidoreductase subunit J [Anaerolineaceae bacterium]
MTAVKLIFLMTAVVILGSAVAVVSARKIIHAALWLVLTLLGVAVMFALLESSFFAVVQVLVYIGAISILIIFAVMLSRSSFVDEGSQTHRRWWIAAIGLLVIFVAWVAVLSLWPQWSVTSTPLPATATDLATLGKQLVDPNAYLLPFELSSILLVTALVGAIFTAMERKGDQP